jgi:hypothetical protein
MLLFNANTYEIEAGMATEKLPARPDELFLPSLALEVRQVEKVGSN